MGLISRICLCLHKLQHAAAELQQMRERAGRRFRIRDFDPFDVRIKLPAAVQIVADQVAQKRKVYIHCTAGKLPSRPCLHR